MMAGRETRIFEAEMTTLRVAKNNGSTDFAWRRIFLANHNATLSSFQVPTALVHAQADIKLLRTNTAQGILFS